jgi:predicted nucleic acid-binding protein
VADPLTAIIDTSVLVADDLTVPAGVAGRVASLSWAELRAGLTVPGLSAAARVERRARLERLERAFGPGLPFDDRAAASYELVCELTHGAGRKVRGRAVDLMIAAVAHANAAAVVTANAGDLATLGTLVQVIAPRWAPDASAG